MDTAAVADVLYPVLGEITIEDLRQLTGGASRTTWAFTARTATGPRKLILRCGPGDDLRAPMELEATAQSRAAAAGTPVATVLTASNSPLPLGDPYLICDFVDGETIPRRIQRHLDPAGRIQLLIDCATALAAIHRADTDRLCLPPYDPLLQWRQRLDAMHDTTAMFEWAFRWLETHRPPPSPMMLVHGDFRMGNLLIDGAALQTVLDWELVHLGQAYEDLAGFCMRAWRFGASADLGAGGLGSTAAFIGAYEQASGMTVDAEAMRWWQVMCTLGWGVYCRYQAQRHLSSDTRSVELAAIG